MKPISDYTSIGKIGKPHGIHGAFFVDLRDSLVPLTYSQLFLQHPNVSPRKLLTFQKTFKSAGRVVLQTVEIDTRNAAEDARGGELFVQEKLVPVDDSKEFLWSDIIGREVYFKSENIATVSQLYEVAGQLNLSMKQSNREVDLPFNPNFFAMDFKRGEKRLELIMNPLDFADLWVKF